MSERNRAWDEVIVKKPLHPMVGKTMMCVDVFGYKAMGKIINVYENTVSWRSVETSESHIGLKKYFNLDGKGPLARIKPKTNAGTFDEAEVLKRGKPTRITGWHRSTASRI